MHTLDLFRLDGKVVLVTGAGSGLGQAIASAVAEAGADVACVDIHPDAASDTVRIVEAAGRRGLAVQADVTDEADVQRAFRQTVSDLGHLDVVFANAGIAERRFPLVEAPLAEWQRVIDLDLTGVFLTVREAARVMVPRRRGKIITTASIYGFVGAFDGGLTRAYAAAKAGVVNFTRSVAIELGPQQIQVNGIAPTYIQTNLTDLLKGESEESRRVLAGIAARTPLGRVGQPDDVKGVAVFLASPASDLMTGHTVAVDGGWLAW